MAGPSRSSEHSSAPERSARPLGENCQADRSAQWVGLGAKTGQVESEGRPAAEPVNIGLAEPGLAVAGRADPAGIDPEVGSASPNRLAGDSSPADRATVDPDSAFPNSASRRKSSGAQNATPHLWRCSTAHFSEGSQPPRVAAAQHCARLRSLGYATGACDRLEEELIMATFLARSNRLMAVVLVVFGLSLLNVSAARAESGQLKTYNATAAVAKDGAIAVKATMTFDGVAPASVQQVFDTTRRTADLTEYRFTISEVTVTSGGKTVDAKVSTGPSSVTLDIPTAGLTEPISLSYTVVGAAVKGADGDTMVIWPLLQGLSVPVQQFNAQVSAPAQFNQLDCAAGAEDDPSSCTFYGGGNHDNPLPVFRQDGNASGTVVIVTLGFPAGQIAVNEDLRQLWTVDRAFSVDPLPLTAGLGLLILGALALWLAHRKIGRDYAGVVDPVMVAGFHPIAAGESEFRVADGIGPGAIGTLADERVDPIDVTATILDLAVRGHLLITELPRESGHAATEWTFTRRHSEDKLAGYERILLDAVAPIQGDPVKLSNLPGSLQSVIPQVQSELYDEVVAHGWFVKRPDATRDSWGLTSWIVLVAAAVMATLMIIFTSFGLLALALVLVALGLMFVSREMPARTASGTAVLRGLEILHGNLLTHPVTDLSTTDPYRSISVLLPYAVVLGGRDRWLQAMAQADDDALPDSTDLDWYHGPDDWHLSDLPASLSNFVTTVQGTLFSR